MSSYPPHSGPSLAPTPVVPWHDLLPLLPPPAAIKAATAPAHPQRPDVKPPPEFVRSVHASPAAWPRAYASYPRGGNSRAAHPYFDGPPSGDKIERAARIEKGRMICGEMPYEAREWDVEEAREEAPAEPLWVPVERWRRKQAVEGGVTLIMLHANGMPKEDFHPVIRRLLAGPRQTRAFGTGAALPSRTQSVINDIFFIEDILHGVGQDLNAGHLPSLHAWSDYARDALNFIYHVLPSMTDNAPWQLEWKPESSPNRRLVGIGHSLGGCALVHASYTRPETFDALFLIEPMTQPTGANSRNGGWRLQGMTLKRRGVWPSHAAAEEVRTNALFSKFHPEAFATWQQFGIVPTGNGDEVALATPPWAEACVFSDPRAPQRGWDLLPKLQCPVGFLMAEDPSWMGGAKLARELVWRPPRARNERVAGAGHLVVQEKPAEMADALGRFVATIASGTWDQMRGNL